MTIGEALKKFRGERKLEQKDLAEMLGTTQQTISNWESGREPRADARDRILGMLRDAGWVVEIGTGNQLSVGFHRPPASEGVAEGVTPIYETPHRVVMRRSPETIASELEARFFGSLPADIQPRRDAVFTAGGVRFIPDYLTDNLCLEIKTPMSPGSLSVQLAIHHLSLARTMLDHTGEPDREFMVLLIGNNTPILPRISSIAALEKIGIHQFDTPESAAKMVTAYERGEDWYDELEEDS